MSISTKKLLANRHNGAKSGGPRTEFGKRVSSQNAFRDGIYSKAIVLATEDVSEFQDFRKFHFESIRPLGSLEVFYTERIVITEWKLRRVEHAEAQWTNTSVDMLIARVPLDSLIEEGLLSTWKTMIVEWQKEVQMIEEVKRGSLPFESLYDAPGEFQETILDRIPDDPASDDAFPNTKAVFDYVLSLGVTKDQICDELLAGGRMKIASKSKKIQMAEDEESKQRAYAHQQAGGSRLLPVEEAARFDRVRTPLERAHHEAVIMLGKLQSARISLSDVRRAHSKRSRRK